MIYDQNFKIISKGNREHTYFRIKNNTIKVVYMSPYDEFEILFVEDFNQHTIHLAIFEYYGIDIKEMIICKQVPSDITEYFIKYHSDEILIFDSLIMPLKYMLYSDMRSDKLITTITLFGE